MQVGILGCGWLGERIVQQFLSNGHKVYTTNTHLAKAQKLAHLGCTTFIRNFIMASKDSMEEVRETFLNLDAIIISVKVARNADEKIQNQIFENIVQFLKGYQNKIILFSTTGIYPQVSQPINENTFCDEVLHHKVKKVEQIIQTALPQTNVLRLSGLMGDNRLLKNWIKKEVHLSEPKQLVNYVHYEDVVQIVQKLILSSKLSGEILNVVAPEHPTKLEVFRGENMNLLDKQHSYRIIDGTKLENLISYTYEHTNPIFFS